MTPTGYMILGYVVGLGILVSYAALLARTLAKQASAKTNEPAGNGSES
jgi:hypothetical protein